MSYDADIMGETIYKSLLPLRHLAAGISGDCVEYYKFYVAFMQPMNSMIGESQQ